MVCGNNRALGRRNTQRNQVQLTVTQAPAIYTTPPHRFGIAPEVERELPTQAAGLTPIVEPQHSHLKPQAFAPKAAGCNVTTKVGLHVLLQPQDIYLRRKKRRVKLCYD